MEEGKQKILKSFDEWPEKRRLKGRLNKNFEIRDRIRRDLYNKRKYSTMLNAAIEDALSKEAEGSQKKQKKEA